MKRQQLLFILSALNVKGFDSKLSNRQLRGLFDSKIKNLRFGRTHLLIKNDEGGEADPVEMMMMDEIGKDPWSGEGISAKDVKAVIDGIDNKNRPLHVLTDSPGGYVNEGVAIRNLLNEYPGQIVNTIIGRAASTASWCIPADEVRAYKSSEMFVHCAWGLIDGNSQTIEANASAAKDYLETQDNRIADMYADQTGRPRDEMLDMMHNETLMTGEEAMEEGFVDTLIDGEPMNRFSPQDMDTMKKHLAALNSLRSRPTQGQTTKNNQGSNGGNPPPQPPQPQEPKVKRTEKIALLNSWGVNIKDETTVTDARLDELVAMGKTAALAAFNVVLSIATLPETQPTLSQLQQQINQLTTANTEFKRQRLTGEVDRLVNEDRIPEATKAEVLEDLMRDENRLEKFYNKLPPKTPGTDPVGTMIEGSGVELVSEALNDIQKYVAKNCWELRDKFVGKNADNYLRQNEGDRKKIRTEMAVCAKMAAKAISNPKNKAKIISAWNANTIDAGLQRQVIFTDFIEEFAIILLPFETFSKVYSNVPLEGTDKVDVPFYPLSAVGAQSWNPATGYNTIGGTTLNTREIQVGGDGNAAPANLARDRKYIGLQFSSYELRRQPYQNWEQHAKLKANELAVAVVKDVISSVINAANYGAAVKTVASPQFSADDVADLMGKANNANWPTFGRWLVMDSDYQVSLTKDSSFKQYLAYGSTDPIRMGLIKEAYGFENILFVPNLKNYSPAGQNLVGWINHLYGVLFATAPIMPTEDVLHLMTRYDLIAHPQIDLVLEHRQFGDVVLDVTKKIVEISYGAALGRASSLQRCTSA